MKPVSMGRLAVLCALSVISALPASAVDRLPLTTSSAEAREAYLKGRDLSEKLRATDARSFYEQAAAKDPSFAMAQVGLANTAKYIELIPVDPNPYDSYAELLMKMGRFDASIANYEKALSLDPNFVASYIGIGNDRVFMGQPEEARKAFAKLAGVARNDGEKRQALFWTAMSYVHEGGTDKALAELGKMAAIDEASKDLAARAGVLGQMGAVLLEAGRADEASAKYEQQLATIDRADVPAEVKEAAHRQALFQLARVALARKDLATARAKADAYAAAVAEKKRPFEVRQQHELAGRLALAEKSYATAVTELQQANQQDPAVLYLLAVALQGKGEAARAREMAAQAADFNSLSATYGFVRGKARAIATVSSKN